MSMRNMSNIASLPVKEGEIFREGYLRINIGASCFGSLIWGRRFFILQHHTLSYFQNWSDLRDDVPPLGRIDITDRSTCVVTEKHKRSNVLAVAGTGPDGETVEFIVQAESDAELEAWGVVISMEIQHQSGQSVDPPRVRSRFFEGPLYKTPAVPKRWEQRWCQIQDGEFSYWGAQGVQKKGVIGLETAKVFPNKTEAPGVPSPHVFQIHSFKTHPDGKRSKRVFNFAAMNQEQYLDWLKALQLWVGKQRPSFYDVNGSFTSRGKGSFGEV